MISPALRRYYPLFTQAALIASGLVVSFGFPLAFGVTAYGQFVQLTAITFIAHRVVDLATESLLVGRDYARLAVTAVLVALLVAGAMALSIEIARWTEFGLAYPLFVSLVLSTIVLNMVFQSRDTVAQLAYASVFVLITIALSLAFWLDGSDELTALLTTINLAGAAAGIALIAIRIRRWERAKRDGSPLAATLRRAPELFERIALISFNVLIAYGVAALASSRLAPDAIGALRIFSSIALLGATLTPINPKSYYQLLERIDSPADLLAALRPFRAVIALAGAGWLMLLALLSAVFDGPIWSVYLLAAALYPTIAFISMFDKLLLRLCGLRRLALTVLAYSICATALLGSRGDLQGFAITLFLFIAAYPIVVSVLLKRAYAPLAAAPVLCSALAAAALLLPRPAAAGLLAAAAVATMGAAALSGRRVWTR